MVEREVGKRSSLNLMGIRFDLLMIHAEGRGQLKSGAKAPRKDLDQILAFDMQATG